MAQLRSDVPAVLRAAARQLREKPIKTRMGAFGVLRELVLVMPEAVTADPGLLVPGIVSALNVRQLTAVHSVHVVRELLHLQTGCEMTCEAAGQTLQWHHQHKTCLQHWWTVSESCGACRCAGQQQQRLQSEDAGAPVPAHRAGHPPGGGLPAVAAEARAPGADSRRRTLLQGARALPDTMPCLMLMTTAAAATCVLFDGRRAVQTPRLLSASHNCKPSVHMRIHGMRLPVSDHWLSCDCCCAKLASLIMALRCCAGVRAGAAGDGADGAHHSARRRRRRARKARGPSTCPLCLDLDVTLEDRRDSVVFYEGA